MAGVRGVRGVAVAAVGVALLVGVAGCSRKTDNEPPVATPAFSVNKTRAALGSPVVISYRFQVAQNAPAIAGDYRVMVHVLDNEDVLMWTDDHDPAIPTSKWKPGQTIEYSRELFVPIYPYTGTATVRMGLYAEDGKRLPLAGENDGQRGYTVGTIDLLPQSENVFLVYKDGWNPEEVAQNNPAVTWQWTKRSATLSFKNPRRDALLYLDADARPDLVGQPVQVTLRIGETVIETLTYDTQAQTLKKIPISNAQFGSSDNIDLVFDVTPSFVPAQTPAANSKDPRELGLRVFHAFVEPK